MSSLDANSTLTDVAFAVCTALERAGEHAVLCGGSAATSYEPEEYESRDLDFVLHFGALTTTVDAALVPLGYVRAPATCGPAVNVASIEAWTERELRDAPVYDRSRRDRFLVELELAVTRRRPV
jgi:hypothetical protein